MCQHPTKYSALLVVVGLSVLLLSSSTLAQTKLTAYKNMVRDRSQSHLRPSATIPSTSVENGVWTSVFELFGIKSANNKTDTDNDSKFISLFYDGINQRMRMDAVGMGVSAEFMSTSVLYEVLKFYMNAISVDFCIFEHLHPNSTAYGARIMPFNDKSTVADGGWTIATYKQATLVKSNVIVDQSSAIVGMKPRMTNVYKLDAQSDVAIGLGFFLFNYQGPAFVDVNYYEDVSTKQPVRFEINNLAGFEGVTSFDVVNFKFYGEKDNSANVFSKDIFMFNAKPTCH